MEPATLDKEKIIKYVIFGVLGIFAWVWVSNPLIITTTGTGEVSVPATNATISISLAANGASPQEAQNAITQRVQNITQLLKNKGVSEEDIAQSQITTYPAALATQGAEGFQASVGMGAKTKNVSTISSLVSDLYNSGAVTVSQPVLSVENEKELEEKAVNEALKNAKKDAGMLALKNWKIFRKLITITQSSSPTTSTATVKADAVTSANNTQAAENGVFKIVKSVSVVYKFW